MISKTILVFLIATTAVFSLVASKAVKKEHADLIDCDSFFSDVIELNEDMMKEISDVELKRLFKGRNSDMASCLDFYTNLLAKLDEFFASIDELEPEQEESKEFENPEKSSIKKRATKL
jgi:hypothetical protein